MVIIKETSKNKLGNRGIRPRYFESNAAFHQFFADREADATRDAPSR
jgi:hypothetical protein